MVILPDLALAGVIAVVGVALVVRRLYNARLTLEPVNDTTTDPPLVLIKMDHRRNDGKIQNRGWYELGLLKGSIAGLPVTEL